MFIFLNYKMIFEGIRKKRSRKYLFINFLGWKKKCLVEILNKIMDLDENYQINKIHKT